MPHATLAAFRSALLAVPSALGGAAFGAVLQVPGDYPTITAAIIASSDGDEIVVGPGVYTNAAQPIWSSANSGGHALKIRSSDGPAVTILDGEGVRRVVELFAGEDTSTTLEGFTLRNGAFATNWGGAAIFLGAAPMVVNCVFETSSAAYGGAVANYESGSAVFIGCEFRANQAEAFGGAVANFDASPVFMDCVFEDNHAGGGAIFSEGGGAAHRLSEATYIDCVFEGNSAQDGGGLHVRNDSAVTLIDCVVLDNLATTSGGGGVRSTLDSVVNAAGCRFLGNKASAWGGGIMSSFSTSVWLVNCEFSGNQAGQPQSRSGGGLYTQSHTGAVVVVNSVFSGNMASSSVGGGWHSSSDSSVTQANNIFWGNLGGFGYEGFDPTRDENDQLLIPAGAGVSSGYCVIDQYAATPGAGHIGADPLLMDPLGSDGIVGTMDDDLRVMAGSPAIDAGDNGALPADALDLDGDLDTAEQLPVDAAGNARRADDPSAPDNGAGAAPIVDIGAYEAPGAPPCPTDIDGDGDTDFGDLNIVLGAFNTSGAGLPGDVDGDGDVDFADLNMVLGVFNTEC